jgi:hypothetical protein
MFIIGGDLNASITGDSKYDNMTAIMQLLGHPKIQDSGKWLTSNGGWEGREKGEPEFWERSTAVFGRDFRTRIDYILPSKELIIIDGGVYWPSSTEDSSGNANSKLASDHRLVWLDMEIK